MRNIIALAILIFHCILFNGQVTRNMDSTKVSTNFKFKNSIGLFPWISPIIELQGGRVTNALFIANFGVSYEHLIAKHNALNYFYSHKENIFKSDLIVNSKNNIFRVADRFYIKQTKNHLFCEIGPAYQFGHDETDSVSIKIKQANLVIGIGLNAFIKSKHFKKLKPDRLSLEIFIDRGIGFTTIYPKFPKDGWPNQPVSLGYIGIRYNFNAHKKL